jgi:hypothetical protein
MAHEQSAHARRKLPVVPVCRRNTLCVVVGQITLLLQITCQSLPKNINCLQFRQISIMVCAFRSAGGAYRDRHGRWQWNAMDACVAAKLWASRTKGMARTVKSCGPGLPELRSTCDDASHRAGTGARKPIPGEITYKPLKPLRREGRACWAKPVVLPRAFFLHAGHGRGQRPVFPAPSDLRAVALQKLGRRSRREAADVYLQFVV